MGLAMFFVVYTSPHGRCNNEGEGSLLEREEKKILKIL